MAGADLIIGTGYDRRSYILLAETCRGVEISSFGEPCSYRRRQRASGTVGIHSLHLLRRQAKKTVCLGILEYIYYNIGILNMTGLKHD